MQLETPIVMMVFNRPQITQQLFNLIAVQQPKMLLIIADGPRQDHPGEAERCAAVRSIVSRVDWSCDVRHHFSDINLGCRVRISSGLNWVFEQVEQAIILEDDCHPHPTFFRYCEELLNHYRDDPRIMHITGNNFQRPGWKAPASYYFSQYPSIWGWATWRRAWKFYDVNITTWPAQKAAGWPQGNFTNPREAQFWIEHFDQVHAHGYDTWDIQWSYACFLNKGLAVTPAVNLVSNKGFGPQATHTVAANSYAQLPTRPLTFPLKQPVRVARSKFEDEIVFRDFIIGNGPPPTLISRVCTKLRAALGRLGV